MINLAGKPKEVCDAQCRKELEEAGIPLFPFEILQDGEVKTTVWGFTAQDGPKTQYAQPHWRITRAWYYWIAVMQLPSTNRFTMAKAMRLHDKYGQEVRVDGDCTAPSPLERWGIDGIPWHYHIDTQEGLNAFAKAILE